MQNVAGRETVKGGKIERKKRLIEKLGDFENFEDYQIEILRFVMVRTEDE